MYAKSILRQKVHFCTTVVKNKLFTAYFGNIHICALRVNFTKVNFQQFVVALQHI